MRLMVHQIADPAAARHAQKLVEEGQGHADPEFITSKFDPN
jgi:hypothetical protein